MAHCGQDRRGRHSFVMQMEEKVHFNLYCSQMESGQPQKDSEEAQNGSASFKKLEKSKSG